MALQVEDNSKYYIKMLATSLRTIKFTLPVLLQNCQNEEDEYEDLLSQE